MAAQTPITGIHQLPHNTSNIGRYSQRRKGQRTRAGRRVNLAGRRKGLYLRISEVVAVNIGDLKERTLTVHASKTDQEGEGETLYVCEATRNVLTQYREQAEITRGAVFRHIRRGGHVQSDRLTTVSARRIIKKRAAHAGVEGFISGHSLRVGSAVSLAQAGATVVDMQVAGRWKSSQMPAHYAKAELAERGAIARFKDGKR